MFKQTSFGRSGGRHCYRNTSAPDGQRQTLRIRYRRMPGNRFSAVPQERVRSGSSMSRDADTLSLNHFKITKVEAVSDKHRACVVRNAYSKESITRSVFWVSASDFTLETEESHRKFETRRGGGAKDAEFR